MDYVIAGLGFGAILAIAGFCLRELAGSRPSRVPRWVADTGVALMFASLVIWAATAAAFFSSLPDATSNRVVAGSALVALVGSLSAAAFIGRSHRLASVQTAVVAQSAPRAQEASAQEGGEAASGPPEPQPTVNQLAAAETSESVEPVEEPTGEKDWHEIWRQTWGSDSVPRKAPEPVVDEAEASVDQVDQAVLEAWEGPAPAGDGLVESEGAGEQALGVEPSVDGDQLSAVREPEVELPVESAPDNADLNVTGDGADTTPETRRVDDDPGSPSPNGEGPAIAEKPSLFEVDRRSTS